MVKEVHAAGGKIAPQLWHQGMMRKPGTGPHPEGKSDGPSGLAGNGKLVGEPMTEEDIADTVEAFAKAAAASKEIGFDCVELHGAHGYLIDQFFWDGANKRTDIWGGDLVRRTRFAAEIVKAVRKRVGPDYVIIQRFSQWKQQDYAAKLALTPKELEQFLRPLTDAGVDIYHASTRRFWEPEFEGSDLNLAGWTKKITGLPAITVGSVGLKGVDFVHSLRNPGDVSEVGDLGELEARLARGEFDLVAVGRALISDAELGGKGARRPHPRTAAVLARRDEGVCLRRHSAQRVSRVRSPDESADCAPQRVLRATRWHDGERYPFAILRQCSSARRDQIVARLRRAERRCADSVTLPIVFST